MQKEKGILWILMARSKYKIRFSLSSLLLMNVHMKFKGPEQTVFQDRGNLADYSNILCCRPKSKSELYIQSGYCIPIISVIYQMVLKMLCRQYFITGFSIQTEKKKFVIDESIK